MRLSCWPAASSAWSSEKFVLPSFTTTTRAKQTPLDAKPLRLFDLLHTTGSVTRTAEQLGQSQPTISIWLARLRRDLRDPLFIRGPSGIQPTPRADALVGTARQALEALRRLTAWEDSFVPATSQRRFVSA